MQNLKLISERNFIRGYNDRDKPENLRDPKNGIIYMADIVNAYVDSNKIVQRYGYDTFANAPVSKAVLGQDRFEPAGGTKYILRARNTANDANAVVEGYSGSGNWVALTGGSTQTASLNHEFVTINNACYIFNGTDTVLKTTNGTSTSTVAAIPKGSQAVWFHNFLFVLLGSRLNFSDVNTPETFDGTNGYIDINPGDNESLTAWGILADTLLLFKPSRVWGLTGYGTADFTLANLAEKATNVGTNAPRSVVSTPDACYYLSFQGDTPHFRRLVRSQYGNIIDGGIISSDITGTMKRLVIGRMSQCAGLWDGRRIRWSVCTSGTTNNEELVYDTITGGWTRNTGINANVYHISTLAGYEKIYFGSSTANGKSYVFSTNYNDDTAAIAFSVKTPMYAPVPGRKCRYKYMYLTGDVSSDTNVTTNYSPDGFSFQELGIFSLIGQGAEFGTAVFDSSKFGATTVARDRLDFAGGNAYYMQYQFTHEVVNQGLTLREWELFYQEKPLRNII